MDAKSESRLSDHVNKQNVWLGARSLEVPPPPPVEADTNAPRVSIFDQVNQYESSSQKALNVQQRAEASKVFPKELLGDWQPREKALLLEIEQLKMKLMEHNRPVIPRPTDSNSTSTNLRIKEGNAVDKH